MSSGRFTPALPVFDGATVPSITPMACIAAAYARRSSCVRAARPCRAGSCGLILPRERLPSGYIRVHYGACGYTAGVFRRGRRSIQLTLRMHSHRWCFSLGPPAVVTTQVCMAIVCHTALPCLRLHRWGRLLYGMYMFTWLVCLVDFLR